MKKTTPAWLLNKSIRFVIDTLFPLRSAEVDGLKFRYLRKGDPPQDPVMFSSKGLEFHDRIQHLSGDGALDIGANIGSYALRLARSFRTVTAFEPVEAHCRVLRINVALNHIQNVRVEQVALSDSNGVTPLYVRGGATSLNPSHYGIRYANPIQVRVTRLDDFDRMPTKVDFVKIDVEGYENRVIQGGKETIARFRPTIAIEVHRRVVRSEGACSCETCQLLKDLEYSTEVTGEFSSIGDVHWVWAKPVSSRESLRRN